MTEVRRIDPETGFIREFQDVANRVRSLETAPAGVIVTRERFEVADPTTGVKTVMGQLPDGTVGFQPFVGDIVPPPVATTPVVSAQPGIITVAWDGLFVNNEAKPRDFEHVNVIGHKIVNGATVLSLEVGVIRMPTESVLVATDVAAIGESWQFSLASEDFNGNTAVRGVRSAAVTMLSNATDAEVNAALQNLTTSVQTAQTAANTAQTAAGTAQTAANNANQAALDAAGIANTKGKVITQSATPSVADQSANNLWIDTTSGLNTPKRWNGSVWVAVTDKAATDAAAAAAAAQTKADQAFNNAATASTAAGNAQTSADSKNTVWYQTTAPSGTGHKVGDTWFDTANGNRINRWSGSAWVNAQDTSIAAAQTTANSALTSANGKNTTYYQTTQPSGGTYITGDTWFDTDDSYKLYTYTGSAWQVTQDANAALVVANSKVKTFIQSTAPTATTAGDIWIDTANGNQIKRWSGSAWVDARDTTIASAQSTANTALTSANGKNRVYYQTAMPTGGTYILGDTWFDTANGNKIYVHNGTTFIASQDTSIAAAQSTATTANTTANSALTTANSKTKTYFQTTSPGTSGNTTGDIWFDISTGNKPYVWNGTAWTSAQDTAIAAAQTSANGKNRTYYQTAMPTGGTYILGDTWFDTDDGYKIYVHNGTTFVASQDTSIAAAQTTANTANTAAGAAQTTANSKIKTFIQGTTPTATTTGDIWIDTANGNVMKTWEGSSWVLRSDAAIATAQTAANTAQTTANGKNKAYYQTAQPTGGTYAAGDLWFDTDDSYKLYTYSGSAWVLAQDAATAQTTANTALTTANAKTKTYFQTTQPSSTGNTTGDLWFDTGNGNKTYVWNGTAWTLAQDTAIAAAQTSANGKNRIYYQTAQPSGGTYITGDTWFDTDDGNKIYVYNGSSWIASQDAAIAAAQTTANTANTTANSKTKTFVQASAPTATTTGDIWIDTASGNIIKIWDGSAWVNRADTAIAAAQTQANTALTSANGKNRVYYQTAMPTGGTYILGDTWFDTANGNKIYVHNGTTFIASQDTSIAAAQSTATTANTTANTALTTANGKTKTFIQSTAPTATTTGDIWIDTANGNVMKTWEGSSWVTRADAAIAAAQAAATTAQTSANGKNTIISAASAPATAGHIAGDIWFDTSTGNKPMVFSGAAWVSAQDTAIATAQTAANTAQTTANGKNTITSAATAPATTGRIAGDIWFDTSNGNKPMTFNGTAWVTAQDASIATAQTAANTANTAAGTAQTTANSKTKTFIQGTTPTATTVGDIWIDTANGNLIKTWEGSSWVSRADAAIAAAQAAATSAQTSANGKNTIISAASAPATAGHISGDIWFDTSNGNKPMIFNGTTWVTAQDASIATAQTAANTAQTTASGKNAATYSSAVATGTGTRAGDIWFQTNASNIVIGQWQWSGSAWVQQTIDNAVIANLDAAKINAGYISAARIAAGTITSSHIATDTITAGNIAAGAITASELSAGSVQAGHLTANSVSATAMVANTITAAQISAATITAAQIASGTITATQIATDTITAGNIAAGAITASELSAGAVTAASIAAGTITATQIATDTITAGNIASGAITASELSAGAVTAASILAGTITSTQIATDTITAGNIASDAITANELAANSITAAKGQITDAAITTAKIADAQITTAKIANLAVTDAQIASATITSAKIANLDAGKITTGTLDANRIGANTISATKMLVADPEELIANPFFHPSGEPVVSGTVLSSVSTEASAGAPYPYLLKIQTRDTFPFATANIAVRPGDQFYMEAWVRAAPTTTRAFNFYIFGSDVPVGGLSAKFASGQAVTTTWVKKTYSFTVPSNATYTYIKPALQVETVGGDTADKWMWYVTGWTMRRKNTGELIVDGAIQAGSAIIGTGAIGTAQIANLAVTDAQIASATITSAKIAALDAGKITTGTLDANRIGADTITATHIASDAITANELAANSITAAKGQITDAAITTAKIADAQITTAKIANLAVTNAQIADATIASAKISSLDAGKITAGTLDANRIGANTITAAKLVIGSTDNILAEPNFTNAGASWTVPSGSSIDPTGARNGGPAFKIVNSAAQQAPYNLPMERPTEAGAAFFGSIWIKSDVAVPSGGVTLGIRYLLSNNTYGFNVFANSGSISAGVWTRLSGRVVAVASAISMSVYFASQTSFTTGSLWVDYVSVARASTGELIVDGAIQAGSAIIGTGAIGTAQIANLAVTDAQIASATITSAKIAALDAGKITTGTLDANRIGADTITATHIASDAITANELAANSITAAKGQISDLAVTTAKINDLAITDAKIANATISSAKIGSVDAGTITVGTLSAARIGAGTVTADKVLLADINNYWENPDFEGDTIGAQPRGIAANGNVSVVDISALGGTVDVMGTAGNGTGKAMAINALNGSNNDAYGLNLIPVNPGDQFYIEYEGRHFNTAGTANAGVGFRTYGPTKAGITWTNVAAYGTTRSTVWVKKTGSYTVPAGTAYLQVWATFSNNAETTNRFWVDNLIVRKKATAELIVDGLIQAGSAIIGTGAIGTAQIANLAVTDAQIASATITSAKIAALDAGKITTGTLDANRIGANTITTGHLAAGAIDASVLTAGSITAPKIAAKTITTDKLVITSTDNLIVEANFGNNGSSWGVLNANKAINDTAGRGSLAALRVTGSTNLETITNLVNKIPVGTEDRFRGSMYVKSSSAAASGAVKLRMNAYTTATAFTPITVITSQALAVTAWTLLEGYSPALPANTIAVEFFIEVTNAATATTLDIDYVSMTRAADGKLIVDGAIDGKTITGAMIRTAATGARIQLDTTGIYGYDSTGANYLSGTSTGLTLTGMLKNKGVTDDDLNPQPMTVYVGNLDMPDTSWDPIGVHFALDNKTLGTYSYVPPRVFSSGGTDLQLESGIDYNGNPSNPTTYASINLQQGGHAQLHGSANTFITTGTGGFVQIQTAPEGPGFVRLSSQDVYLGRANGTSNVYVKERKIEPVRFMQAYIVASYPPNGTTWGPGTFTTQADASYYPEFCSFPANDQIKILEEGVYMWDFTFYAKFLGDVHARALLQAQQPDGSWITIQATERPSSAWLWEFPLQKTRHALANTVYRINFAQNSGATQQWDTHFTLTKLR